MILNRDEIKNRIATGSLVVSPLLDPGQIGEIALDLRLGYNFIAAIHGRNPYIDASLNNGDRFPIASSFQDTRKLLGESFLLHPNQTVLTNTLEYLKLPNDVYADLTMRSSYLRLGLSISAIVQPGYCGCFSLELTNVNKVAINLTIGAPLIQARFFQLSEKCNYFSKPRKYMCQVRPVVSAVNEDSDLVKLNRIWKANNHIT